MTIFGLNVGRGNPAKCCFKLKLNLPCIAIHCGYVIMLGLIILFYSTVNECA